MTKTHNVVRVCSLLEITNLIYDEKCKTLLWSSRVGIPGSLSRHAARIKKLIIASCLGN